jgi:hypothetical protein
MRVSTILTQLKLVLLSAMLASCMADLGDGTPTPVGADAGADPSEEDPESEDPESDGPEPETPPQPQPDPGTNLNQACYQGEKGGVVAPCFNLAETDPYVYPAGTGNYSQPMRFLDLDVVDLDTKLSSNFRLGEISVRSKGKYQVVQPHAIAKLQQLREMAGHALTISSGYRSPDYNASVGGATKSRHMYGDAFDINAGATGRDALMQMCRDLGAGYVAKYAESTHIHCDWRNDPVDPSFFGIIATFLLGEQHPWTNSDLQARMLSDDGVYSVEASGYDACEGELARDWIAFDNEGNIIAEVEAMTFVAPPGTASVQVSVGGLMEIESALSAVEMEAAR